ncbi:DUF4185 domain-containing protein [Streptosporangium carneum]|uniref:DUF4185 domain-containing protein n=1 Tax=Streptosporangium carneum TaxID=47481 RepID=A0A9W6I549_9ACTN|nr:DUF4185 domain-containing protein [Streptosporangium carneum]GLK12272.1 hypothetical protein GCM10017600_56810 [Streptosporangium carneum]
MGLLRAFPRARARAVAAVTALGAAVTVLACAGAPAAADGAVVSPGAASATSSAAQPVALVAGQGAGDVNQTRTRFGVHATDLGVMWRDSRGRVAIAFGDTYGEGWGGDGAGPESADWRFNTLAHSGDSNLADGMRIDSMVTDRPGHARQILPRDPAVSEVTVIPTAAVSVGSRDYIHYMSVRSWGPAGTWVTNYSGLAYSDDGGENWTKAPAARWANQGGGERFQMAAMVRQGGFVHLFGTPNGRFGNAYLARVAESRVLETPAYEYWTASGWQAGAPDRAVPVAAGPVGELSVQYNSHLRRWIALHLDENRAAIVMRTAPVPTGPWTGGQVVAHSADYPGLYGGFLHPDSANGSEVYFAMSRWSPYHVQLMRLRLADVPVNPNLVQDGGFEDRLPGAGPAPWIVGGRGGVDYGKGNAHSGLNNGWVRHNSGWNNLYQKVVLTPRKRYRLSGWMRSSGSNSEGYFGIRKPSGQGVVAEQKFGSLPVHTRLNVEFTAGDANELEVFVGGWSVNNQDFWIQADDIVLEELP